MFALYDSSRTVLLTLRGWSAETWTFWREPNFSVVLSTFDPAPLDVFMTRMKIIIHFYRKEAGWPVVFFFRPP